MTMPLALAGYPVPSNVGWIAPILLPVRNSCPPDKFIPICSLTCRLTSFIRIGSLVIWNPLSSHDFLFESGEYNGGEK